MYSGGMKIEEEGEDDGRIEFLLEEQSYTGEQWYSSGTVSRAVVHR